jgi:hypothetical protein
MINKRIAIVVFIEDLLKDPEHSEPAHWKMSDAKVITIVLVSAMYFSGHYEKAMSFMSSTGMVKNMLSKRQHELIRH